MGETVEELGESFDKWREAFESRGMGVSLGRAGLMVGGVEEEAFDGKMDPCGVCGTWVMSNLVLCGACGEWVHAGCTEKKKVSVYVNKNFVCGKCGGVVNSFRGSADERLCDGVEAASKFTYLGGGLNATGGCETAVTAGSEIGWMGFGECGGMLKGRRFSLRMKGKICRSCVGSTVLCGGGAWCLREREMAILRRTEGAVVRAMCGVKLLDRGGGGGLMDMLGMEESLDGMAGAGGVRWCGHVLRKEDEGVMEKALGFGVSGGGGGGGPKQAWRKQVRRGMRRGGQGKEDACDRAKWRGMVKTMTI